MFRAAAAIGTDEDFNLDRLMDEANNDNYAMWGEGKEKEKGMAGPGNNPVQVFAT
jgi:hypothetical protein